ncbi:vWA domain-containing protein [Nonomuraea diastatica]|uniref:VWA domain-containing protein n=1 Tax=Nonomuraea diastatica TaxID=1848329 RepID=A0A4R4X649_9ACTN|nr:vWA domain-containing protein [Nonomuraea diastatica]TDD25775.1 VWA domain-containing protein [Nonomuraea diastatica]
MTPAVFERLADITSLIIVATISTEELDTRIASDREKVERIVGRTRRVTLPPHDEDRAGGHDLAADPARTGRGRHERPRLSRRRTVTLFVLAVAILVGVPVVIFWRSSGCFPVVQLNVLTTPEKQALVEDRARAFERELMKTGQCAVTIQVSTARSAHTAIDLLSNGWGDEALLTAPRPHVWLPGSALDLEQAKRLTEQRDLLEFTPESLGSIARSRLVLAVPPSYQEWTGRSSFTWPEVSNAVARGELLLARSGPRSSSSGLAATMALYRHAPGGTGDVHHRIEQNLESPDHEGSYDLMCAVRHSFPPPAQPFAVLTTDKVVEDYNAGRPLRADCPKRTTPEGERLHMLVPAEQPVLLDHPYVLIGALTPRRDEAARALHTYLRSPASESALKKHHFAPPGKDDGAGTPPGGVEEVLGIWERARKPTRLLVALDVSGDMRDGLRGSPMNNRLAAAAAEVYTAVGGMGPRDQVGLWTFADRPGDIDHEELMEIGETTKDETLPARLQERLNALKPESHPGADPRDVVHDAIDRLRETSDDEGEDEAIDAVLLITSGDESPDRIPADLRPPVSTPVFVVALGLNGCAERTSLRRIAEQTRGQCYDVPGAEAMERAFDGLAVSLWGGGTSGETS